MAEGRLSSLLFLAYHLFTFYIVGTYSRSINLATLSYYEVVEPQHLHLNGTKRSRPGVSTLGHSNQHLAQTAFLITGFKRVFHLQIYKNNFLISRTSNLITQDQSGGYVYSNNIEHCYYHGYLVNKESSSVVLSTCSGLKGVIKDSDGKEFVIVPHPDEGNTKDPLKHVLYNNRDVVGHENETRECGLQDNDSNLRDAGDCYRGSYKTQRPGFQDSMKDKTMLDVITQEDHHRWRRSVVGTRYIEVVLLVDHNSYLYYEKKYKKDGAGQAIKMTQQRGLAVMSYVDAYYKTINTRVVVTNLIVWNVKNMSPVTSSAHETLNGIKAYTRDVLFGEMKLNFDNAQLMIYEDWGYLGGLATVGVICSMTSAAVSRDITTAYSTANTVAHEMGHNIGFSHYNNKCSCTTSPCVMSSYNSYYAAKGFANCTKEYYEEKLSNGELPCLLDYPDVFFGDPVCGNGLLEANETCDCGTEDECNASGGGDCCNFATCKLKEGMDCATGLCCEGCKFKAKGVLCRNKLHLDCDIEEYCTGASEACPKNKFLSDGGPCNNDTSYCYQGTCKTHDAACEFLWGHNAKMADELCFNPNAREATQWAGCGKNSSSSGYIQCKDKDKLCGKLQCRAKSSKVSLPRFPVIGSSRGKRTVKVYSRGSSISCIQGKTSVAPDMGDPTVAPDGVKCGLYSICINNKCIPLRNDTGCDPPCKNGGHCLYDRTCLCKDGFIPPACEPSNPVSTTRRATTRSATTRGATTRSATTRSATTIVTTSTESANTSTTTTTLVTSTVATTSNTSITTTTTLNNTTATSSTITTTTTTPSVVPPTAVTSVDSKLYWLLILLLPVVVVIAAVSVKLTVCINGGNKMVDVNGRKSIAMKLSICKSVGNKVADVNVQKLVV